MILSVNHLIRWGDNDLRDPEAARVERILFIDETGTDIAAINVDRARATPVWYKYEEIKAALITAEVTILQIDHRAPRLLTASDLEKPNNQKI